MQVLVLNSDYTYLNIVGVEKAMAYITKGKVIVEKYSDKVINTFEQVFRIPAVVRFIKMARLIYKKRVNWSKKNVLIRDGHTCQYCGAKADLSVDHIIPKSKGGPPDTFENTVAACKACNNKKGDKLPREAGMLLLKQPKQPTIMEFIQLCNKQATALVKEYWESMSTS